LTLGSGLRDCWFADGCALGLEITALRTAQDFIAESAVMENCLDQYAAPLAYGRIRVFRVRKGGRSVASLELALRSDDATVPSISQLRGPRNRRTPTHVWQAVHAWLGAQPFKPLVSVPTSLAEMAGRAAALWSAYEHRLEQVALRDRLHPRPSSLSAVLQRSRPTAFRTAANLTRPRPA